LFPVERNKRTSMTGNGNGSVLAELMAMREENPKEAKRRFNELNPEELNVLSLELGVRLCTEALKTGPEHAVPQLGNGR